jgi:hypothetical protein
MTLQKLINVIDYSATLEIHNMWGKCLMCGNRMQLDIPDDLIDLEVYAIIPGIVTKIILFTGLKD